MCTAFLSLSRGFLSGKCLKRRVELFVCSLCSFLSIHPLSLPPIKLSYKTSACNRLRVYQWCNKIKLLRRVDRLLLRFLSIYDHRFIFLYRVFHVCEGFNSTDSGQGFELNKQQGLHLEIGAAQSACFIGVLYKHGSKLNTWFLGRDWIRQVTWRAFDVRSRGWTPTGLEMVPSSGSWIHSRAKLRYDSWSEQHL